MAATFETVRKLAAALPEVDEGTSYGTPALRVRGKFMARLREDGATLVVKADNVERDFRILADPDTFFITDHYAGGGYLLVRLATASEEDLRSLLTQAWRLVAPKQLREGR